ncbi:MAG: hypothetical protein AAF340_09190 [Pseudomonadota bacterium]
MRHVIAPLLLCTLPFCAMADSHAEQPQAPIFEGFEGLADSLRELFGQFEEEVTPFVDQLGDQLRDLDRYHPPEVLPNGDIIIRRKAPETTPAPETPEPESPIEI